MALLGDYSCVVLLYVGLVCCCHLGGKQKATGAIGMLRRDEHTLLFEQLRGFLSLGI